jgi:cytochrome c-type biogenesis protein
VTSSIFFGGSIIAATVAGMIALFAPCCISVMLPAYFASAFQNRRLLVAMTFLFAAGLATVILPIVMGAAFVRQLITTQHTPIYLLGGAMMVGLALYLVFGGQIHIPSPGHRAGGNTGPLSVYTLGVFSGIASSCCAPVLAGVVALSGVASSFGLALTLGLAYVFGMVMPLFVMSLLWERFNWRESGVFRPRSLTWRIGPLCRTLSGTSVATALLLGIMGGAAIWIGLTGNAMPTPSGWQQELSVRLQHAGQVVTEHLSWLPGWAAAGTIVLVLALLGRHALRQVEGPRDTGDDDGDQRVAAAAVGSQHE